MDREGNAERKAFHQFAWHLGGSQGDVAIFDAFTKRNLEGGLLIYLEWLSAEGERRRLMPHHVCGVRTILTRSISTDMEFESAAEMNILAGAAMLELFGGLEEGLDLDNWARWGVQAAPRRPEDEINEE